VPIGGSGSTTQERCNGTRSLGYVATRQTIGAYGETTGLRVQLLDLLLPYWEADQPPAEQGVTQLAGLQGLLNNQDLKRLAGGCAVLAYPRYRKPRQPMRHA
jgi:hypothetical protein